VVDRNNAPEGFGDDCGYSASDNTALTKLSIECVVVFELWISSKVAYNSDGCPVGPKDTPTSQQFNQEEYLPYSERVRK